MKDIGAVVVFNDLKVYVIENIAPDFVIANSNYQIVELDNACNVEEDNGCR